MRKGIATKWCLLCLITLTLVGVKSAEANNVAQATLTVQTYLSVNVSDIQMSTVTPSWLGQTLTTSGSSFVDVYNNVNAVLRTPMVCVLNRIGGGGSYTVNANIVFFGNSQAYPEGLYPNGFWCLDYTPGPHPASANLMVSYTHLWTLMDAAGTYQGTITLTLTQS